MNTITDYTADPRFSGLTPFPHKLWLSSPTMHGDEQRYANEAIQTNWVSTVGENIDEVERMVAARVGRAYGVALSSGTAALHLAVRLAGERLYGIPRGPERGALEGRKVFCSDMTFDATVNPVAYEGGEAVFIDTDPFDWNMDPEALERGFELYPDVKLIVLAHLYGTPGKCDEIRAIADAHNALVVEDAAESLGAAYISRATGEVRETGAFGDYSILSFNGNKIITGSAGGMLVTDSGADAHRARKWSTQAREDAAWYQHEELGYNYRMSNVVAGIVRGQVPYLSAHIQQKKEIYERYRKGLEGLPVSMNPIPGNCSPNYWLSCLLIDGDAMCPQVRSGNQALYTSVPGKSCPTEILGALGAFNAEGRPIWKPMHMQPMYRMNPFVTVDGIGRGDTYIDGGRAVDVGADIFRRGLCLPSDNKMKAEEQEVVIEIIRRCFK